MKRLIFFTALALAVPGAHATVSFDVAIDRLDDQNGVPVPAGALVLLVADTDGDGLGQVLAGDVSLRSFLDGPGGDDLVVFRSNPSSLGIAGAWGGSTGGLELDGVGNAKWSEGDPLYLVWFSNLSLATQTLSVGEAYGARALGLTPIDGGNEALVYVAPVNSGTFGSGPLPGTATNLRASLATTNPVGAPSVTSPTAVSITGIGATLGGEVTNTNGGAISTRGVVYSLVSANAEPALGGPGVLSASTTGGIGVFSLPVSGLNAGSTYAYRAYATNSGGSGYSATSFFTTDTQLTLVSNLASVSRQMHPGDRHRFRFSLTSTRVVDLSTGGFPLFARLFGANNLLIAEQTTAGNVNFSGLLLASGTYTLDLSRAPGEGGAEAYTLALDASKTPLARPDGAVGSSLTTVTGNFVYPPTTQRLTLSSPDGRTVTGYITATNRGNVSDRIRLKATGGNSNFAVVYFNENGANVTAQVTAGTYTTRQMLPNESPAWVRAAVTPSKRTVEQGKSYTITVDFTSLHNTAVVDRVSIQVKTR